MYLVVWAAYDTLYSIVVRDSILESETVLLPYIDGIRALQLFHRDLFGSYLVFRFQ